MAKATKKQESVVKPSVTFEGDSKEHVLETLMNSSQAPVVTSVGVMRVPGTNNYISYTVKTQGTKVVSIEVEEPNLRAIAEETAKINFVNLFMSGFGDD